MPSSKLPPLTSLTTFSSELINARSAKSLTQSQLSAVSGLSLSAIKAYESGRNMPGARELRELCQALEISPNKLLFGTEYPFQEPKFEEIIVDHPEHELLSHGRLIALLNLVTADERQAVITLLRSLALARHGEEKVKAEMTDADALFGVMVAMLKVNQAAHEEGKPLSADEIAQRMSDELEQLMSKQGHIPKPK